MRWPISNQLNFIEMDESWANWRSNDWLKIFHCFMHSGINVVIVDQRNLTTEFFRLVLYCLFFKLFIFFFLSATVVQMAGIQIPVHIYLNCTLPIMSCFILLCLTNISSSQVALVVPFYAFWLHNKNKTSSWNIKKNVKGSKWKMHAKNDFGTFSVNSKTLKCLEGLPHEYFFL